MALPDNGDQPAGGSPRRPNLIFVMADQLGASRCGYAGDEKARTPNIDRLASEGVNFRQAVASSPVCAAFRASLFTGKYTTSTGMVINELRLGAGHECFGHVLSRGGYRTGYIGKWHLYANEMGNHLDPKNSFVPPGPDRLGFDGTWAAFNFNHGYYNACYHTDSPAQIPYGEGAYEPDAQTDLAIDFIRGAGDVDDPFALFLSYGTPHDPWSPENVPPEYLEMFSDVEFPHPPNYEPENDPHADGWGQLSAQAREHMPNWRRVYHAMTANLDWNLGRLLDAIAAAGLSGDTIIVFTSDHGEMFGSHGRGGKNIFYEEAARIPLLVRWPGRIAAGTVSDVCLSTVDIMPTLLSLMDLSAPRDAEGMDLSHCALGTGGPEARGRVPSEHRRLRRLDRRARMARDARQAIHLCRLSCRRRGAALRQRRRSISDEESCRGPEARGDDGPFPRDARRQDGVAERHVRGVHLVPRPLDGRPHHPPHREGIRGFVCRPISGRRKSAPTRTPSSALSVPCLYSY